MAISKVADRYTLNSNTAGTTFDYVLTGLTVGNILIIRTSADNTGGGGAARTVTVTNQSGTAIDTGTDLAYQQNNDPGASGAGVTCNVIVAEITDTSGTVRLTYSGSVTQAGVAEEWTGIALTPVGTPQVENSTTTTLASPTDASIASGNLAYVAIAVEGPASDTYTTDSDTTNGSWVELTKAGTSTGTATTECTIYGGYKVTTGTGAQTFDPTINNTRDSAAIIIEFASSVAHTFSRTDPAGITDARVIQGGYNRTFTDLSGLEDEPIVSVAGYLRQPDNDPLNLSDAANREHESIRSQVDAAGLVDAITYDHQTSGEQYAVTVGQNTLVASGTLTT